MAACDGFRLAVIPLSSNCPEWYTPADSLAHGKVHRSRRSVRVTIPTTGLETSSPVWGRHGNRGGTRFGQETLWFARPTASLASWKPGVNNLPYQNPPFVQAHEVINGASQALPSSSLDQGFSGFPAAACTVAALQAFSPACLSGSTLHLTDPNLQPAMDQQWNLTIQRQLGQRTSVQIDYVGNKIDHMSDIFIYNQEQLQLLFIKTIL